MWLHLGDDVMVLKKEISLILDYANIKTNAANHAFFKTAAAAAKTVYVTKKQVKSLVMVQGKSKTILYHSPISSATLLKRSQQQSMAFGH